MALKNAFSTANWRQLTINLQSNVLFLMVFYPRSSIDENVFDSHLFGMIYCSLYREELMCGFDVTQFKMP